MSRYRYVGGKTLISTGGEHNIYSDGNINIISNKKVSFRGENGGVKYGEPLPTPDIKFEVPVKCRVEFRPHRKWQGEFGFDWVRTGDTNLGTQDIPELAKMKYDDDLIDDNTNPFIDYPFKDIVGYIPFREEIIYETDTEKEKEEKIKENERRNKDIGTLEELDKKEYTYLSKSSGSEIELYYDKYRKLKNSGRVLNDLLKEYYSGLINGERYYIPVLSLLEGNSAELDLYITSEKVIDKIEVKIIGEEAQALLLNGNESLTYASVQTGKGDLSITVSCKQEFTKFLTIEVYQYTDDNKGELCGKLIVIPNSQKQQKEVNVALVRVVTKLNNKDVIISDDKIDEIKKGITKYFTQALLIPRFAEYQILLTDDDAQKVLQENSVGLNNKDAINHKLKEGDRVLCHRETGKFTGIVQKMIKDRIPKETLKQYKDYYNVLLVEEPLYSKSKEGYFIEGAQQGGVSIPGDRNYLICFRGGNDSETISHELFHSLGLGHIFYDPTAAIREKHNCFKKNYTSNLLDYSKKRISTYYWQWKILNKNIK